MAEQKFILPDAETVSMSGRAASLLISSGCPEAALIYIYILKNGGAIPDCAASDMKISKEQLSRGMSVLGRLGLVKTRQPEQSAAVKAEENTVQRPLPADQLPDYSISDIRREIAGGTQFSMLVEEVQRALGKILSSDDLIRLFGIYDSLRIPPEVILQLVTFCIEENRRKYGQQKLPTMRYIEKVAYTWEHEEIFSLELAEEYIKRLTARREMSAQFASAMQIRDRELTVTERKYITDWLGLGFGPDAAAIAFDRTVTQTGRLTWKYMDSIMRNWHGKGLHTADDIRKQDTRVQKSGKPAGAQQSSAPTAADIERMRRTLEKINEGQG